MKRSEINAALKEMEQMTQKCGFQLPPFCSFTPEEWAYTCDKTFKAFRVTEANQAVAYAVRFHRRGYYDQYIKQLPEKWQDEMYAVEAAIIKMYNVFKEDVNTVRPYQKEIGEKMLKNRGMLLTTPIFY